MSVQLCTHQSLYYHKNCIILFFKFLRWLYFHIYNFTWDLLLHYITAIFSFFFNMRKLKNLKKCILYFMTNLIFMAVWKYFMLMAAGH